jgi:hypothetical protein
MGPLLVILWKKIRNPKIQAAKLGFCAAQKGSCAAQKGSSPEGPHFAPSGTVLRLKWWRIAPRIPYIGTRPRPSGSPGV